MIDIDFSPISIAEAFKANAQILDEADTMERMDFPEHDDIEKDLKKSKKEIDSCAKNITSQSEQVSSELSGILNKDFEHKFKLFVQLLTNGLTEESFPIEDWIEQKENIEEVFRKDDFYFLANAINETKNKEIKKLLISEYANIVKCYLNCSLSFKYNSGMELFKGYKSLIKDCEINDIDIFEQFKKLTYIKENDKLESHKICSNANYWNIYSLLTSSPQDTDKIIDFVLHVKDKQIAEFVFFLEKTDFFIKRNYKNQSEDFKKEPIRETLFLAENKELRENFFLEYVSYLENISKKSYLSNEKKEIFDYVLKELRTGHQYLTLLNKLDKKLIETKKLKI